MSEEREKRKKEHKKEKENITRRILREEAKQEGKKQRPKIYRKKKDCYKTCLRQGRSACKHHLHNRTPLFTHLSFFALFSPFPLRKTGKGKRHPTTPPSQVYSLSLFFFPSSSSSSFFLPFSLSLFHFLLLTYFLSVSLSITLTHSPFFQQ